MPQSPHRIKKVVFSELPSDFVLFKQYNISAKQMYQKLFALHSVDATHQEVISVKDIYAVTGLMDSLTVKNQGTSLAHRICRGRNWYAMDASRGRLCDSFGGGRLESWFSTAVQSCQRQYLCAATYFPEDKSKG